MAAESSIQPSFHPLWLVALVTLLFAILARILRGVTLSGAAAGTVVCFVLYSCAGFGAFFLLMALFILTWGATRFGYQRKQRLGTAERKEGRTASQVLANVGIAVVCAAIYRWEGSRILLVLMTAAFAEAAADTVSSEIGQSFSGDARLITTWSRVPPGTQGGVTLSGTLSGVGAALLLSLAAAFSGLISPRQSLVSFTAAFLGTISDSYLGATLESRGILNNNRVNFLGTLASVLVAGVANCCT